MQKLNEKRNLGSDNIHSFREIANDILNKKETEDFPQVTMEKIIELNENIYDPFLTKKIKNYIRKKKNFDLFKDEIVEFDAVQKLGKYFNNKNIFIFIYFQSQFKIL